MRKSGILLHISSLPSPYGIGSFGKAAYDFVDQLKEAGQGYWQVLPMGPIGFGDSPYQSFSAFAGNPYFIDLDTLIDEGLLTKKECDAVDFGNDPKKVDYAKMYEERIPLLKKAYTRAYVYKDLDFQDFVEDNAKWLWDYSMFMALKDYFNGSAYTEWPDLPIHWTIIERNCILRLNSINFYNISFLHNGRNSKIMPMHRE